MKTSLNNMQIAFLLSIILHLLMVLSMLLDVINPLDNKTLVREMPIHVEFAKVDKETKAPVLSPQKKVIKKPTEDPIQKQEAGEGDETKKPEDVKKPVEAPKKIDKPEPIEEKKQEIIPEKKETPLPEKPKKKEKEKQTDSEKKAVTTVDKKQEKKASQRNKKETLDDLLDTPIKNKKEGVKKTQGLNASKEGPVFTTSEISRLKAHISKCWNIHAGAKDAKDHIVDIEIHLNKEGYVEKAEILNKKKLKDLFYKVAAETAQRSLLDPDCNPLPIPSSDYKKWSKITFRFNPSEMF